MALKFIVEAETATTAYVTKQQRTEIFVFSNSANKSISYQKTIKRYLSTNVVVAALKNTKIGQKYQKKYTTPCPIYGMWGSGKTP